MQFVLATDYAIRALLYLTMTGRQASASEISERMRIPKQYLITTSNSLRKAGLIVTELGTHGGYSLARSPSEISLLDIIRVTEGSKKLDRCLERQEQCGCFTTQDCPVRDVYVQLQGMAEEYLSNVTLADLKKKMREARDVAQTSV